MVDITGMEAILLAKGYFAVIRVFPLIKGRFRCQGGMQRHSGDSGVSVDFTRGDSTCPLEECSAVTF